MAFDDRAAIILRAAELLAGPWRETLAASTMLGQSKTVQQAEIDSPCELVDFWRFNVHYARQILAEQPIANAPGVWNRLDHRPLEGFVYAITPFNFTAIAGNLPTAPALMGNVVVWKPSPTQTHSAVLLMKLLREAGLPDGVINLVTGDGIAVSEVALSHPDLAGIHFTGSTKTFQYLWRTVGENIARYRSYPRIVGETGGKDFVVAHPSADPAVLKTALTRGSFEYQGQKCSASSRAYLPRSLWDSGFKEEFAAEVDGITMGDVTDLTNFLGAVIDERAFAKNKAAIDRARADPTVEVLAGGTYDDSVGYFVRPTVLVSSDPDNEIFREEYFGPILSVHVYEDAGFETMLAQMESVAPYALTGSVIARDRAAAAGVMAKLRYAAGNFYINDKSTGAVVGQQPFGGGRASGTNDKAGAAQNLMRWTSTRAIKETLVPPTDYRYPHQG
jgi:1-pyrroline-5-carboxylate dehydrogenase